MAVEDLLRLAEAGGVPVDDLLVATTPGQLPAPTAERWVVVPLPDGETVIGGFDRGQFASYGQFETDELAANALVHLHQDLAAPAWDGREQAGRDAQALAEQLRGALDGEGRSAGLPEGTALDHIGHESGHFLFLLDTPFGQRSAPPTDLNLSRTGYRLRAPLPAHLKASLIAPWFGQPGGGVVVRLDRPVRYYYDTGLLDRFAVG